MASDTESAAAAALPQIPSPGLAGEDEMGLNEPGPPSPRDKGLMETIRRLSRRLSGAALEKWGPGGKTPRRPVYSYDGDTGEMIIGGVRVPELVASYGTPLYVYDVGRILDNYNEFLSAMKPIKNFSVCYAVKANSTLGVLDVLNRLGSGFDVVSGGELTKVLNAGVDPKKVIYSGCGKTRDELSFAVEKGVGLVNVESLQELEILEKVGRELGRPQDIAIRINPGVNFTEEQVPNAPAVTAVANAKFGVPLSEATEFFARAKASAFVTIKGLACHLGSGINSLEPYLEARDKLLSLADELRQENRVWIEHINMGGGFAAPGSSASIPDLHFWIENMGRPVAERGLRFILEPGRSLLADSGILVATVQYVKTVEISNRPGSRRSSISLLTNQVASPRDSSSGHFFSSSTIQRTYAIVDAGFNDFGRPSVYGTAHRVIPCRGSSQNEQGGEHKYDVVGPISETSDCLAKELVLQTKLEPGSLLCITDSGAYGLAMSSNYCSRRRPAEVMASEGKYSLIRERDTYEQLFANERTPIGIKLPTATTKELVEEDENSSQG